jgi:hypothetical protein
MIVSLERTEQQTDVQVWAAVFDHQPEPFPGFVKILALSRTLTSRSYPAAFTRRPLANNQQWQRYRTA